MDLPTYLASTSEDQLMGGVPVRVITCLARAISQDDMPAGKDLIIYGDNITLGSSLTLPGKNLTIISRVVTIVADLTIDLSGADATSPGGRAADGNPGTAAQPDATDAAAGIAGSPGANAGNLTIVSGSFAGGSGIKVRCRGGAGGRGQDGGNGGTGLDGAPGEKYEEYLISGPPRNSYGLTHNGMPGANGGRAGAGGQGGRGGNGGSGGSVSIAAFSASPEKVVVSIDAALGSPGDGGIPGTTGGAGRGGAGAALVELVSFSGKGGSFSGYRPTGGRAADGAPGAVPAPAAPGQRGQPGVPGPNTPTVITSPDFYNQFSPSAEQRLLTLRQAELLYLTGVGPGTDYIPAARLLLWLRQITTPPGGTTPAPDDDRRQMHARVTALLAQISQRLDYYGQPADHVPLADLSYYLSNLADDLTTGATIESTFQDYVAAAGTQAAQLEKLKTMQAAAADQTAKLVASRPALTNQITSYQDAVANLKLARNQQGVTLVNAERKWETGVIEQLQSAANGAECKIYEDIFKTLGNVATLEAGDLEKMKDKFKFGEAGFDDLQTISGDVANWQDAVTHLAIAQGDVPSIVAAANTLAADAATGDAAKVAVDRATFDLALQPYKTLDGTGTFQDQINLYLAKAQAFSQKQLDYNALQTQLLKLDATIAQQKAEQMRIQSAISLNNNPDVAACKVFMARTYGETLDRLIRAVFGLRQAFRYWSLAEFDFPPANGIWNIAYLSAVRENLTAKVTDIINGYGSSSKTTTEPFDYRGPKGAAWNIKDPGVLEVFRKSGQIDFSIPLRENPWVDSNFAGFAQVVATDFTIQVRGAALTSGQLFVRLIHNGRAPFLDSAKREWVFSHLPVEASYKYDLASGDQVAGGALSGIDGVQIGLSPFTTWTLRVLPSDNLGLDLSHVDQISLRFAGRYHDTAAKAAMVSRARAE